VISLILSIYFISNLGFYGKYDILPKNYLISVVVKSTNEVGIKKIEWKKQKKPG